MDGNGGDEGEEDRTPELVEKDGGEKELGGGEKLEEVFDVGDGEKRVGGFGGHRLWAG